MEIESMIQVISNIGFPIFVAIWLLWRSDEKEVQTQKILNELKEVVVKLSEKIYQKEGV